MRRIALALVFLATQLAGCDSSFNRDLAVGDGARAHAGGVTVNGRILVGADAEVVDDLRTVNGSVRVGQGSRLRDLTSVNGGIELADGVQVGRVSSVNGPVSVAMRARIGGELRTVNGGIRVEGGTIVDGDVTTVNGPVDLRGVTVHGTVANHAGDVRILDGTLVEGDLVLHEPDHPTRRADTVVIGVGTQVRGVLRAERSVRLFVHPSARIGRVVGAKPVVLEGTDVPSE